MLTLSSHSGDPSSSLSLSLRRLSLFPAPPPMPIYHSPFFSSSVGRCLVISIFPLLSLLSPFLLSSTLHRPPLSFSPFSTKSPLSPSAIPSTIPCSLSLSSVFLLSSIDSRITLRPHRRPFFSPHSYFRIYTPLMPSHDQREPLQLTPTMLTAPYRNPSLSWSWLHSRQDSYLASSIEPQQSAFIQSTAVLRSIAQSFSRFPNLFSLIGHQHQRHRSKQPLTVSSNSTARHYPTALGIPLALSLSHSLYFFLSFSISFPIYSQRPPPPSTLAG